MERVAADAEWQSLNQRISDLVAADPAGSPREDMADAHRLSETARVLRKAMQDRLTVAPPLPHWRAANARASEERTKQTLRR